MANATQNSYLDQQYVRTDYEQTRRVVMESGRIVQNDWVAYTRIEEDAAQAALPVFSVEVWTHDGGLENGVDDNWVLSDGATLEIEFWDPDNTEQDTHRERTDGGYTTVIHTFAGLSAGAATNAEAAASLNADTNFTQWAYALIDGATANRVTLVPKGRQGRLRVVGGTAASVLAFPGTEVDNNQRTFTRQPLIAADWTVTYDAGEKEIRVLRANATAAERVMVVVLLS